MAKNAGKKRKFRGGDDEQQESNKTASELLRDKFEKLSDESNALIHNLTTLTSEMESHMTVISEIEKKQSDLETKVENNIQKIKNRIVNLNIGGRLFTTSKETLMSIKGTYFYGMLSSDRYPTLPDGSYFIERNPEAFQRILDYLRTGKLIIDDLTKYQLNLLKDDFDYYSMDLPEELLPHVISWNENSKADELTLSNNNLTVTKAVDEEDDFNRILGSQSVDQYTVRIDEFDINNYLMVGFRIGEWGLNDGFSENGWFLDLKDGEVSGVGIDGAESYTAEKFASGDYVTVIREGTTIRFQLNKVDLGVCTSFTDIPNLPLLPTVDIYGAGDSLTLIHDY